MLDNLNKCFRCALIFLFCLYPVVGAKVFPFGDGGRYLSVLAAPCALLLIFYAVISKQVVMQSLFMDGVKWAMPLFPLALAFYVSTVVHPGTQMHGEILSRIFYGVLLFLGARLVGVRTKHLIFGAFIASFAYFVVSIHDVFVMNLNMPPANYRIFIDESGAVRAGGGSNPIHFGQVSIFLLGVLALAIFSGRDIFGIKALLLWGIGVLLALLAALLTLSRGPLLALFPLAVLVFYSANREVRKWLLVAFFVICMFAMSVLIAYPDALSRIVLAWTEVERYFAEPTFTFSSVGARLEMWRVGLLAWSTSPFFGVGFVSYAQLQQNIPLLGVIDPVVASHMHFHNDYMQSLVQGGIVLILGLIATQFIIAYVHRKNFYILWLVSAWVVFSMVDLLFFKKSMLTMFVSAYALYSAAEKNDA